MEGEFVRKISKLPKAAIIEAIAREWPWRHQEALLDKATVVAQNKIVTRMNTIAEQIKAHPDLDITPRRIELERQWENLKKKYDQLAGNEN